VRGCGCLHAGSRMNWGKICFFHMFVFRGVSHVVPPNTPKIGQKRSFWVPPPKSGFLGSQMALLPVFVHFIFIFFLKKLFFIRGGGPPPLGGPPPRGAPPSAGGSPPLIKDRFFRKIRKRRCTKPAIRAFWTPKTLFLGGYPK
jgi:hypothetical protein